MNRVLVGLYIGNYRDSKDASQLERHKITHILAIHDAARRLHTDKEYMCIAASDTPYQNLAQYFPACNDFIHNTRIQGGNVLIHCLAGMSRSVTIAVAYIMSITSLRWNEALKVVRGARAVSNPNSGFQKQLQEFENTKLADERSRLLEKFPGTVQLGHDEENCRKLLIAYDHLLLSKAICEGKCASARVCPTGTCRAHSISTRYCRQRSQDNSTTTSSPRGSTRSLDSTGSESPTTQRAWERHYGCWKNHVKSPSNSTPGSPIVYRASRPSGSSTQRSDSMLSISSVSSVMSLPSQVLLVNEDESQPPSIVDRNPHLSTQSCPNSPRRMPRKVATSPAQQRKVKVPGQSSHSLSHSRGTGVSPEDVVRVLNKDRSLIAPRRGISPSSSPSGSRRVRNSIGSSEAGVMATISESSTDTLVIPGTSNNATSETHSSKENTAPISSQGRGQGGASSSSGTSTCPRFLAHSRNISSNSSHPPQSGSVPTTNSAVAPVPQITPGRARNTIRMASGITRWVMKRSAYRFTSFSSDKS